MSKGIKIPPQDLEVERQVLGLVMMDKDNLTNCLSVIQSPDVFYDNYHALIYAEILKLNANGVQVDTITVNNGLKTCQISPENGWVVYLIQLVNDAVISGNIEAYAKILVEKFLYREMIRIGMAMQKDGFDESADVFDLIDKVQTNIYQLTNKLSSNEPKHIGSLMAGVVSESEQRRIDKREVNGVASGIKEIDHKTKGWQKSDLVIIGARPAVGKTAFSLNLGLGGAMEGRNVLIFSLEMSANQLVNRLAANFMTLEAVKVFNPIQMSEDEWGVYVDNSGKLGALPIYIDDTASLTTAQIRAKAYKLINKGIGLDMIIIDYLQLISSAYQKGRSRENEVSAISRDLKILAKDLNIPVIVLSQLNRAGDSKPTLSNLRESGAIEQDADMVLFLYNGDGELANYVMIDFAKFRNGSTDSVVLDFQKQYQRFMSYNPLAIQPMQPMTEVFKPYGGMPTTTQDLPF
jgi:replicative DNA helicase